MINNMQLFLDFKQSNLNFESTFVEIHSVLIEIRLFEHEFQNRNFGQFRIFEGDQICKQAVRKITTFH